MNRSFADMLDEYSLATRSHDVGNARALENILLDRCADTVKFLARAAELDLELGRPSAAADKWAAITMLRPNDKGVLRQEINALTRQGDVDIGLRRIQAIDFAEHDFEHFYWGLNQYLQLGEWSCAEALLAMAAERKLFTPSELAVSEAALLLETGMDHSAEKLLREIPKDDGAGYQHGHRLLARLMAQRGEYDLAADSYLELAYANGNPGDLSASISYRELLLRYDLALEAINKMLGRWPALASSVAAMRDRIEKFKTLAAEARSQHGSVESCEPSRVLKWLQGGNGQSEILWARQALMFMADNGTLPVDRAEEFLYPLGAWEDWRVNRFLGVCYLRQCPHEPKFHGRQIRTIALDATQREGLVRHLNTLATEALDEDLLVYAIHVLRQLEYTTPRNRDLIANSAAQLRAKVQSAIARTKVEFRVYANAQLRALGIQSAPIDLTGMEEPVREAAEQGAVFALTPWNTGIGRKKLILKTREASVVVALSGQMRGFERAWPTVHEYLAKPLGAPVAISLWDTSKNALGRHARRLERTLPPDLLAMIPPLERFTDVFQKNYPRSAAMIFDKVTVDPARIESLLANAGVQEYALETESESTYEATIRANPKLSAHGLLKMFAKFHRLEQMIATMEAERRQDFTHVCWLRPDARINRFSRAELDRWLREFDTGWGEAIRPNMVGDYILFLPRRFFGVLARIFPALILSGGLDFLGWRPLPISRFSRDSMEWPLGGPDTIAAALFAAGITLREMRCVQIELMGYLPPEKDFRRCFIEEHQ
jgi:hypothetical protein